MENADSPQGMEISQEETERQRHENDAPTETNEIINENIINDEQMKQDIKIDAELEAGADLDLEPALQNSANDGSGNIDENVSKLEQLEQNNNSIEVEAEIETEIDSNQEPIITTQEENSRDTETNHESTPSPLPAVSASTTAPQSELDDLFGEIDEDDENDNGDDNNDDDNTNNNINTNSQTSSIGAPSRKKIEKKKMSSSSLYLPELPTHKEASSIFSIRTPNYMKFQPLQFDRDSHDSKEERKQFTNASSIVRWRNKVDASGHVLRSIDGNQIKESNTRLIKWSDNTYQIIVGDKIYNVILSDMANCFSFKHQTSHPPTNESDENDDISPSLPPTAMVEENTPVVVEGTKTTGDDGDGITKDNSTMDVEVAVDSSQMSNGSGNAASDNKKDVIQLPEKKKVNVTETCLECTGAIRQRMMIQNTSKEAELELRRNIKVSAKTGAKVAWKEYEAVQQNPDKQLDQRIKDEQDAIRKERKQRESSAGLYGGTGGSSSYRRPSMTADYMHGSDDDEDGGNNIAAIKNQYKKGGKNATASMSKQRKPTPGGARRPPTRPVARSGGKRRGEDIASDEERSVEEDDENDADRAFIDSDDDEMDDEDEEAVGDEDDDDEDENNDEEADEETKRLAAKFVDKAKKLREWKKQKKPVKQQPPTRSKKTVLSDNEDDDDEEPEFEDSEEEEDAEDDEDKDSGSDEEVEKVEKKKSSKRNATSSGTKSSGVSVSEDVAADEDDEDDIVLAVAPAKKRARKTILDSDDEDE